MPRRSKQSYRSKQKGIASKVGQHAKPKGRSTKTAKRVAWATGKKRAGGGKKRPSK